MRFKIASIVSLAVLASAASADPNYPYWDLTNTLNFSVDQDLADQGVVVTHIIGFMEGGFVGLSGPARWSSTTWAYRSDTTSSIPMFYTTKYFGSELPEPRILQTTMVGLVEGALPGEESGATKHVVLFMNDAAKAASVGQSWEALFPNTSEDALFDDIKFATENSTAVTESEFERIGAFLHGDAASTWSGQNDPFTMVAFSGGTVIGSGRDIVTTKLTPVPEPASLAALGLGAVALLRRRRV